MSESSHLSQEMAKEKFFNSLQLYIPRQEKKEVESHMPLSNLKNHYNFRTSKKRSRNSSGDDFAVLINQFSAVMSNYSRFINNKEAFYHFIKGVKENQPTIVAEHKASVEDDDLDSDPHETSFVTDEDRNDLQSSAPDESRLVNDKDCSELQSPTVSNSIGILAPNEGDERMDDSKPWLTIDEDKESSGSIVILGPNGTTVLKSQLDDIFIQSYKPNFGEAKRDSQVKKTTRLLLEYVFTKDVLATSSLTGKPSPVFPGRTPKKALDPQKVEDIVEYVTKTYNTKPKQVRSVITSKCADEAKMKRMRNVDNMYKTKWEEEEIEKATGWKLTNIENNKIRLVYNSH